MPPLLQVQNLCTYFGGGERAIRAVDDVSFSLEEGRTLALVGESGCGKSVSALSIMRLVARPGRVVSGSVLFEGEDLLKLTEAEMRAVRGRRIGMIFQEPLSALNPTSTIGRQLTEGMLEHLGIGRGEADQRAVELLRKVGISNPLQQMSLYPHHMSGGMRQRVMIAIALSCGPKLVIADEPTTSLDVTIQAQVLELLKSLTDEMGVALLLITHNLGVVARYADNVAAMYAGKIIETAAAGEFYAHTRHPYSAGLLASVPRLDKRRAGRFLSIEGYPPALDDLPPGCAFRPRCRFAVGKCESDTPDLQEARDGHLVACWEHERVAAARVAR